MSSSTVTRTNMHGAKPAPAAHYRKMPREASAIAANSIHSPPPCGEGLGVGVNFQTDKGRKCPTPNPSPHSQRRRAARGGGEYIESAAPFSLTCAIVLRA